MSFAQLPRIHTVDKRITESESFFRIEEAEAVIARKRDSLQRRIDAKRERAEKRKREGKPALSPAQDVLPEVYPPAFFSAHVINSDPALSKFVDFDELVFPKPYTVIEGLQPDFIDKLWVSGFLDRSNRDADKIARQLAVARTKKVKGRVSKTALAAQEQEDHEQGEYDYGHGADAKNSDVAHAGASSSSITQRRRPDPALAHIHPQTSTLSRDISNLESAVSVGSQATSQDARRAKEEMQARLGDREARRLRALEADRSAKLKKAREKRHITAMVKPYADSVTDYLIKKQTGAWLPGQKQRDDEEAAGASAAAAAAGPSFASFLSVDLDRIFDRERQEMEAAKVLQAFWRKIKRLEPWRHAIKCMLAAARIQRMVRGAIVRKWVAQWYQSRNLVITKVQANVRRMLSNNKTKPRLAREQRCVLELQRVVRGKLGRLRWARVRWGVAASHIQALWRGVVARSLCDKRWLDKVVVPIQRLARQFAARRLVRALRTELHAAALVIQKKIRSRQSCKKLSRRLINREFEYRMDGIACATTEEGFLQEKIGKLVTRLTKRDFQAKAEGALDSMHAGLRGVYVLERDLVEMSMQREILSPRAIVQGFYQELNRNCIDLRNKVTEAKLQLLFQAAPACLGSEDLLEAKIREIEQVALTRDALALGRETDHQEKLERWQQRERHERELRQRWAVAHERRRWQVKYCTRDGKPDKRRRPGRPWDPSVLAKADRQTYNSASVDIFAEDQAQAQGQGRPGETGSVDATLQRMSLQTYLEEVNAYEQILNPITEAMQKAMGGPPGQAQPEDLGWGREGRTLAPAMWTIGAVPPAWARPLSPGGTTAMSAQDILAQRMQQQQQQEEAEEEEEQGAEGKADAGRGPRDASRRGRGLYNLADPNNEMQRLRDLADAERRRGLAEQNRARAAKRAERAKAKRRPPAVIPWSLLDQLEGEKRAWESEKAYMEFNQQRSRLKSQGGR